MTDSQQRQTLPRSESGWTPDPGPGATWTPDTTAVSSWTPSHAGGTAWETESVGTTTRTIRITESGSRRVVEDGTTIRITARASSTIAWTRNYPNPDPWS